MGHYFIDDENLKSNIQEFRIKFLDNYFNFKTDNGVFSKGELDFGTKLLIEMVLKEDIGGNGLDLGCGYGPIGVILSKLKKVNMDMVDINHRAVHLAKENIRLNKCLNCEAIFSDGYQNIDKKYDFIVSNPPIRVGKVKLYELIRESNNYLKENGKIYLVIRKEQGAKSFIKDFGLIYEIEVLTKSKGFYIISLKSC